MQVQGEVEIRDLCPIYERLGSEVVNLIAQGWTRKRIANHVGVCQDVVRRAVQFHETGVRPFAAAKTPKKHIYKWIAGETVKLRKEGLTYPQIAQRLGVTTRQVSNAYHKMIGRFEQTPPPPYQVIAEQSYRLYREGMSTAQIGEVVGCSKWTVRRAIKWFRENQQGPADQAAA